MQFIDFETLLIRARQEIRARVHRGELSERSLARAGGLSQPHIHNVLKGVRELTPATADALLRVLRVELTDMFSADELQQAAWLRPDPAESGRNVAVLSLRLGPGTKWTSSAGFSESCSVPDGIFAPSASVTAARANPDPLMPSSSWSGKLFLLDTSDAVRRSPDARQLYVVDWGGEALIRWVRIGKNRIYIANDRDLDRPSEWESHSLDNRGSSAFVAALALPLSTLRASCETRRRCPDRCSEPSPHCAAN